MYEWGGLSKSTQDVYINLGTRNHDVIKKIKTRRLIKAIRESQFVGYDNGAPYKWLMFEYDRRKSQRSWILGVAGVVIAVAGVIASSLIK